MPEYNTVTKVEHGSSLVQYGASLKKYGILPESYLPYNKAQLAFTDQDINFSQVVRESDIGPVGMLLLKPLAKANIVFDSDFEAAEDPGGQDVERIKRLLQQGVKAIAISYFIGEDFDLANVRAENNFLIRPANVLIKDQENTIMEFNLALLKYGSNLFEYVKRGQFQRIARNGELQGHAVTIVGYDESGFIIKNSWGKVFGDQGYARVSYNYHKLMARRMFALKKVRFIRPAQYAVANNNTDIRLKVIPQGMGNGVSFSIFCMDKNFDPSISTTTYRIYQMDTGIRKLLTTQTRLGKINQLEYDNSFEITALKNYLPPLSFFKSSLGGLEVEINISSGDSVQKRVYKNVKLVNNEYKGVLAGL
ncbi:MAG: hypothetical protein H7Y07_08525 [Pyrinomonadaceae bacterium]|nr:hypothetical protein [Sphingobacteriaceae bacterium]